MKKKIKIVSEITNTGLEKQIQGVACVLRGTQTGSRVMAGMKTGNGRIYIRI